jgi:hypothetical protein
LTTRRSGAMGEPARGYSWEPFRPGNTVALRHGAWSPRKVEPLAAEYVETVAGSANWLRDCDAPAVWAWARTEARVQLLSEWLADRGGDLDDEGTVRPAAALLDRLEARAESLRARLGFDPLSRARLGRDTLASELDLARLWAAEDSCGADDEGSVRT